MGRDVGGGGGRKMSFFSHLEAKSFKRCSSLSVLLGGRSLDRDQGRSLAVGSHANVEICTSVGALLSFESARPSFLPALKPDSFISIKSKKMKKQVIDSKRGKKERSAQPLVTAPNLYTHDPVCVCVSFSFKHKHTCVSSQLR